MNAVEAVEDGGHVTVAGRVVGGMVEIEVADDGRGMDAATLRRAFDPFFSGREAGRGIGLGLPKAWRLVELNGGSVGVESRPGGGTRVTIALPCVSLGTQAKAGGGR
jgi:signal transduction histidine kinase